MGSFFFVDNYAEDATASSKDHWIDIYIMLMAFTPNGIEITLCHVLAICSSNRDTCWVKTFKTIHVYAEVIRGNTLAMKRVYTADTAKIMLCCMRVKSIRG